MTDQDIDTCLAQIKAHYPDLAFQQARLIGDGGQFNTVLCLNDGWIFRFPKSPQAAVELAHELRILPRLQGRLPLPTPNPCYSAHHPDNGQIRFMGYAMIAGEPLLRDAYRRLAADEGIVEQIARDLALFLKALHGIKPADIGVPAEPGDSREHWRQTWFAVREQLLPHMRQEARDQVRDNFERALSDDGLWQVEPCLIHGDFGTGNILFDNGRISGIIDFSFCAFDDPAQDLGALLSSYGEAFIERFLRHYPELRACLPRARFFRGNYALIQALYGLRDHDQAAFEDGMAAFRAID